MTRIFLPVVVALTVVGGAAAQSLSDRLAGTKPKAEVKPEPKVEHRLPSPFKMPEPGKKPAAKDLPDLYVPPGPSDFGKGSSVLKGLDTNPFGKPAAPPIWNPDPVAVFPVPKPNGPNPFAVPPKSPWKMEPGANPFADFDRLIDAATAVRPMDVTKLPLDRATVLGWKKDFPFLGDDFEVQGAGTPNPTSCATKAGTDKAIPGTYNCIAHTAGIKNVWVNPYQKGEGWDLYYNPLRYKKAAGTDTSFVKGVQKVAVYATKLPDGRLKQYTHAAVQEADGTWTSKLGSGPLIRHRTAEAVGGGSYGEVVRVYERKR